MKKLLALMLSLAMVAGISACGNEAAPSEEAKPSEEASTEAPVEGEGEASAEGEKIIILHTNDVHGAIEHYAEVAGLKKQYEAEGAYVLLMDAGDFIQGDPTVNTNQGQVAIDLMKLCDYDAVALGNHEFDFGYENIKNLEKEIGDAFPLLGANVFYEGKADFAERTMFESPKGTKIGVFGLDTPETSTKAHPGKIKGVTFVGQEDAKDMFELAQAQIDALKADGADLVVCLGHLGTDIESIGHRSIDVLENTTGIDIMIDGHSHSTLEEVKEATGGTGIVHDAYVTSTGTKLQSIGKITIVDGKVEEVTTIPTEGLVVEANADVAAKAKEVRDAIDKEYGTVFAKTEIDLDGEKPHVRTGETNMGNLITDAMLWGVKANEIEVDAVVTNGGGIRASIAKGDITKKDINTVLPFANELCIVKVTGAELLEALETSTFVSPEAIGGFPHVAGIKFTLDTSKEYAGGENYPGSTYAKPTSIQRVTISEVAGEPFDPERVYSIATNDFMADGGDTYYVFKAATSNINLGLPLDEIVMSYIVDELGGTITAAQYGALEGRITVVPDNVVELEGSKPAESKAA